MDTFACGHCGASQIVERRGGTISLRLVADAIGRVQVGTDKTAAELALKRLANDLLAVEQSHFQLMQQRAREYDTNWKLFGGFWIGLIIICVFVASAGKVAAVIALLGFVGGSYGIFYLGYKQAAAIRTRIGSIEANLFEQGNHIQRKIQQNRKLVDS